MSRAKGTTAAFAIVTSLFFVWGFITSNNDPLIAALRAIFKLNYTEALLTQFAFFMGYGICSLPAAWVVNRLGSVRGIMVALGLMVASCLLILPATSLQAYWLVLVALFVMASGITGLQVAANPLAAALGTPERSHFRLTFAQAFNSLGVVLGVHLGANIMLDQSLFTEGEAHITDPVIRVAALGAVNHAFLIIAGLIALLMLTIWLSHRRIEEAAPTVAFGSGASVVAALSSPWALFGAVAIFLYVGAEVAISSVMINFLNQSSTLGLPLDEAGAYLANFYWGGALVGRFIGSALLTRIKAPTLLTLATVLAAALCLTVTLTNGPIAGYAALAVGLFNSIMFPTIFSITLERAGVAHSSTAGLLCVAIVGGALLPLLVGRIADAASLELSFVVPLIAYCVIAIFAASARRAKPVSAVSDATDQPVLSH